MSSSPHQVPRCQANRPLALLVVLAGVLVPAARPHAAASTFTLGARRTDTAGRALQLHGLGIVQVGTTWYGFGEDKTGQTTANTAFRDIPCYTSTDLANWTHQGIVLAKQASGDLGPNPHRRTAQGHLQRHHPDVRDVPAHRQHELLRSAGRGSRPLKSPRPSRMSRGRPPRTHPAPTIPVPLVVPALGDVEAQPGLNRQRKLRT
jgi:hypothetical protein